MASAASQATSAIALETVTVTATKRGEQDVQDVPLAVTAFGREQLDSLNFKSVSSLSYTMPNVQLDEAGTWPGIGNFSIRGLGVNSSIPSIDPTVGVFVDGVYMGITSGIVFDNFDLEGVEVLRGPQGILFGRNVTGGAVLLRTRTPGDSFEFDARVGAETGTESGVKSVADFSVMGPLVEGLLSGKLAVYGTDDDGWFINKFNGEKFGGGDEGIVRGALKFTPGDKLDLILRLEYGTADGESPATQNPALFSSKTHDATANLHQFYDNEWSQVILETNYRVGFGDGTITNVFGWREYSSNSATDGDGTNNSAFHLFAVIDQDQRSDELRYAGTFGPVGITAGAYFFQQNLLYVERRSLDTTPPFDGNPPSADLTGGGDGDFETLGAFLAADWHLTDTFTLNLGARYSHEEKSADVSRLRPDGGNLQSETLNPDFPGLSKSWSDVSPKVGVQWTPTDETQVYGFWARGFRSGGYNFRHTVLAIPVQAFDAEEQSSFELGIKQDLPEHDARINAALFHNTITDLQRESNDPNVNVAVQQMIRNVGDVIVQGAELEAQIGLGAGFLLSVQAGYTDDEYDKLVLDISGDGVINETDYALKLPRSSPWTYGGTLVNNVSLGEWGELVSRVSYNHRDQAAFTDNNVGILSASDQVDVNFTLKHRGWNFSLYGSNLLDETTWGSDAVLPDHPAFGGDGAGPLQPRFRPLAKGRIYGAEMRYRF